MDVMSKNGVVSTEQLVNVKNICNMSYAFTDAFFESSAQNATAKGSNASMFKRNVANACVSVLGRDPSTFTDLHWPTGTAQEIMQSCSTCVTRFNWIDGLITSFQDEQAQHYVAIANGVNCPFCANGTCTPNLASPRFVHSSAACTQAAEQKKLAKASRQMRITGSVAPTSRTLPTAPAVAPNRLNPNATHFPPEFATIGNN